ncbi:MAG: hypothetical protein J6X62_01065 [Bacteroidales bacterium]|nr:hypothetical protein [Bacteroidales bacterium]
MKRILLLCMALCAFAAEAQTIEKPSFVTRTRDDFALRGPVKEVYEKHIMNRNDPELQDTDYHSYTFAPDGRLIRETVNDVDRICVMEYTYEGSRLVRIDAEGDCGQTMTITYSPDGRKASVKIAYGTTELDSFTVEYNDKGLPCRYEGFTCIWSHDGLLQSIGNTYWSRAYFYTDDGQPAQPNGSNVSQKRLTHEIQSDNTRKEYIYNKQGDIAEIIITSCNTSHGITRQETFKPHFSYKYDAHGNWVSEGKNTLRRIIYYDE